MFRKRLDVFRYIVSLKYGVIAAVLASFIVSKAGGDHWLMVIAAISAFYMASELAPIIFWSFIIRGTFRDYINSCDGNCDVSYFESHMDEWNISPADIDYLKSILQPKETKQN